MNEANLMQILSMQEECYSGRIGTKNENWEVVSVEYDWAVREQFWKIKCNHCGSEKTVTRSVGRDIFRGKTKGKCEKCAEIKEQEKVKAKKEKSKKNFEQKEFELDSYIGEVINGRIILSREKGKYNCVCETCGSTFKGTINALRNAKPCKHPLHYDENWIGVIFGHLTVIDYESGDFKVRCDCGYEKWVKPTTVAIGKTTTCGRKECEYHRAILESDGKGAELVRQRGVDFEVKLKEKLEKKGYEVEHTKASGDYGVDLIVKGALGRTAIQCKYNYKTRQPVSVNAVQEVYAGGKFYDCDRFLVASATGYTENAIIMAKKLGVILSDENFVIKDFMAEKDKSPTKYLTIDGKTQSLYKWCQETGKDINRINHMIRNKGLSVEEAFFYEKPKTLKSICEEHNILPATVDYRMKKMGMTLEEALTSEKKTMGRPKKSSV